MGYNITLILLNDALGDIEKDAAFGKKIAEAVRDLSYGKEQRVNASTGKSVHCDAATVVETHHADGTTLIAVGQNHATLIGEFRPLGRHREVEGQVGMLHDWADRMGFRLVKKSSRKKVGNGHAAH